MISNLIQLNCSDVKCMASSLNLEVFSVLSNGIPPRAIKRAMAKGPPVDPYLAQDLLLAICHHIAKHDLSDEAVQELLSQHHATGFPCLSPGDTVDLLDDYYKAIPRGSYKGGHQEYSTA